MLAPSSSVLVTATAERATSTILLVFTGPLNALSAQIPGRYGIVVNNIILFTEAARLQGDDTVVIVLSAGSLALVHQVVVSWEGVLDMQGQLLQGRQEIAVS